MQVGSLCVAGSLEMANEHTHSIPASSRLVAETIETPPKSSWHLPIGLGTVLFWHLYRHNHYGLCPSMAKRWSAMAWNATSELDSPLRLRHFDKKGANLPVRV